jgi:transposase
MKAYSVDWRAKVLHAVGQGYARKEIVKLLGLSPASIKRYLKERRETGEMAPHPSRDGCPRNWDHCNVLL